MGNTSVKTHREEKKEEPTASPSALEYLVTYGWAILAVILIGVALYYSGVFQNAIIVTPIPTTTITPTPTAQALSCIPITKLISNASKIEYEDALKKVLISHNISVSQGIDNVDLAKLAQKLCETTDFCNIGTGRYNLPQSVFSMLPTYDPDRLLPMRALVQEGKIADLGQIDEKIWKQPEFFDRKDYTFEKQGVAQMFELAPGSASSHISSGYGTYKSEQMVILSENTTNFDITFFVKADYGVPTFQGIKLEPYYNPSQTILNGQFSDGSRTVAQDVDYAKCHIRITNISPSEMVLEPAYPAFHTGWVKKVTAKLQIQNLKKGKYVININIVPPSSDFNAKYQLKFLTSYVSGGTTNLGVPWESIFIEVL